VELDQLEKTFFALANETRLRILRFLSGTTDRKMQTNLIGTYVNCSPHVASKHLHILREADLVTYEKQGQFALWMLNIPGLVKVQSEIFNLVRIDDESWRNTELHEGNSNVGQAGMREDSPNGHAGSNIAPHQP
jgi:ArsR family transcriptional regulator